MTAFSRRELLYTATLCLGGLHPVSRAAAAEEPWPSGDLHSICGSPAGSGIDLFVRFYSKKLQEALHDRVIVENIAGGDGNVATEYLAHAKPDGRTIGILQGAVSLAAASSLFKSLPFDPIHDFEHVALLAKLPFLLVVPADSPFTNLADLTAALKVAEEGGHYGSVAVIGMVASELYKAQFGLKTAEVKYQDPAAALADLYSGKIAFLHVSAGFAQQALKAGKLRALATSAADPTEATRGIPSAREAGIANSNLLSWWSVQMPKGTPRHILDRIEGVFAEISVDPETRAFLARAGSDPMPGGRKQARHLLIEETAAWQRYAKLANIAPR